MKRWVREEYTGTLMSQICDLSKPKTGFHLNAKTITAEKMKECTIGKISEGIKAHAPDVWDLVGKLLEADPAAVRNRERDREHREMERKANGGLRRQKKRRENEDEDPIAQLLGENEDEPEDIEDQLEQQRLALIHVVSVFENENI